MINRPAIRRRNRGTPKSPAKRRQRGRGALLIGAAASSSLLIAMLSGVAVPAGAEDPAQTDTTSEAVPGTNPAGTTSGRATALSADGASEGLQVVVNERGLFSRSIAAVGDSGYLVVNKPAGATVHKAYLALASQGYSGARLTSPPLLSDEPVALDMETPSRISSYNYFTDVTDIVAPALDPMDAGNVGISLVENDYWQEAAELVVIYNDPAVTSPRSVTILFGALSPAGDTYGVNLMEPVDLSDPSTFMDMSVGISFGYQEYGTQQYSTIDVNGKRLTTSAGGSDDGHPWNGALVTAGSDMDSRDNPADPNATPTGTRSDDELYNLLPFVHDGDQKITVNTTNPSNDDNLFLSVLTMNPPVRSVATDGDTMEVTPESQTARLGIPVHVDARPDRTINATTGDLFGTPYRAKVISGPNTGQPITVTCGFSGFGGCSDGSVLDPVDRLVLSQPTNLTLGSDRIRIWLDTDKDGVLDDTSTDPNVPAEQFATVTVNWTKDVHAVAMGDSYSSGEGVDPYDSGTDDDFGSNRNQCHRSKYAYGRLTTPDGYPTPLPNWTGTTDTQIDLIACSGATTKNVVEGGSTQYPGEDGTQVDQGILGSDTDFVTISIGGNDLGFSPVIKACIRKDCGTHDSADASGAKVGGKNPHDYIAEKSKAYEKDLALVLDQIKEHAPSASVLLLGYPHLFTADQSTSDCETVRQLVYPNTQTWMNSVADSIDLLERQVAEQHGVHFLSVIDWFSSHEICASGSDWLAGATAPNLFDLFHKQVVGTGSFHPNRDGHEQGYAGLINRWLSEWAASGRPVNKAALPANPAPQLASFTSPLTASAAATTDPGDVGDLEITSIPTDTATSCYPEGVVAAKGQTRLWGNGFAPGSPVTITWENPDVAGSVTTIATATAAASGQLAETVTVPAAEPDTYGLVRAEGTTPPGAPLELLGVAGVATGSCSKQFDFTGFFAPVNNAPTINLVNAGSAVPVKFSLAGDQGMDIFADGYPRSQRVTCDSKAPLDEVEQTVAGNTSGLTYAPDTQRYQYVWKTDKAWSGTCRELQVGLRDGTTHTAVFQFK